MDDYNEKEDLKDLNWDSDNSPHSYEIAALIHGRTCEDESPSVGSPSARVGDGNSNRDALVKLEEYDKYTDDSKHISSLHHENDDTLKSSLDGTQELGVKDELGGMNSNHELL
ncbi:hypothetical protein SUGI_1107700 [Cryptomeria japonica]|nr:hypothetical protein SUGI_1107700 [Cryptomeria japonica]